MAKGPNHNRYRSRPQTHTTPARPGMHLDGPRYAPLSRAEELACVVAAQAGDIAARNRLVTGNLRIVKLIACRYSGAAIDVDDLIGEGCLGLADAVDRFSIEVADGTRFITYAVWWVRQRILLAVYRHASMLHIPTSRICDLQRSDKRRTALRRQLGRDPSVDELAAATGLTAERLERAQRVRLPDLMLDSIVDGHDEPHLQLMPSEDAPPDADLERQELRALSDAALGQLDPRAQMIVRWRYGLDDDTPRTLDQIGQLLHVSRERVRQLHDRALEAMRAGINGDGLNDYRSEDSATSPEGPQSGENWHVEPTESTNAVLCETMHLSPPVAACGGSQASVPVGARSPKGASHASAN